MKNTLGGKIEWGRRKDKWARRHKGENHCHRTGRIKEKKMKWGQFKRPLRKH